MNFNFKRLIGKGKFAYEKNKGLIFTIGAATFELLAVYTTAKQAPKAEKILIPANKKIEKIKEELNNDEMIANHLIYPEEHKKEMRKIQRETFISVAKIYALPVIFTSASIAFMGGSYKIMKDKQIALGAAYVTLENAFKSYRDRVKQKVGEEVENDIYRNVQDTTRTAYDESGKEIEESIRKATSGGTPWELYFDAASACWARDGRTNLETLMTKRNNLQRRLEIDGYLFLSDVIDELLIPKSCINKDLLEASRCVGWIFDTSDPNRSCFVDFGICDQEGRLTQIGKDLLDNSEKDVLLTFNCDGVIINGTKKNSFAYYVKD